MTNYSILESLINWNKREDEDIRSIVTSRHYSRVATVGLRNHSASMAASDFQINAPY